MLTWDFEFRFRGWRPQVTQRIHGASLITFNEAGLVSEHRDYWDAAEELYEKLPLIGALPIHPPCADETVPGVYVSGGHGSRGFTFAPFAARLIAAEIMGAPLPASSDIIAAASPMRFVKRALKRQEHRDP